MSAVLSGPGSIDELLSFVELPGEEAQERQHLRAQRTPIEQSEIVDALEELPIAPEELSDGDDEFDFYNWMQDSIMEIKSHRVATEEAATSIQEGIESITTITKGLQQAIGAVAKAFQGADEKQIAKIVEIILKQYPASVSESSSVTPEQLNKTVTPITLMFYGCAGSMLGVAIVMFLMKL